jgi:hypothetical protein
MMPILTRNLVTVCSVVALCAAVVGCSSSGDDDSADLERQLDMALAAQMTAEQERDAAQDAQMMAEQAAIDTRVALAAADKVRDAAAWGSEKVNRVGEIIVSRKLDGWGSNEDVTAWGSHSALGNSGSKAVTVSQSYREGSRSLLIPYYDKAGQLEIVGGLVFASKPLQWDPQIWPFWAVDTGGLIAEDVEGITLSQNPIESHGLGAAWQGLRVVKTYDGGGELTVHLFTDLAPSDNPGTPFVGHPGGDATYANVVLDDPALTISAEWDGLWVGPGEGLRGSLDGVPGTFTCGAGDSGYCGLEDGRHHPAPGFTADVAADPVVFTPDDGSGEVMLPHPEPTDVPTVNYLEFGNWLFVPEDITDLDAYNFGVFAGGDDPFMADNFQGLAGTADYAGEAAGTYADVPQAMLSSFEAKVELTADFGTAGDLGTIAGRVYDFELEGGQTSPLTELSLNTPPWLDGGQTNIFPGWYFEGAPPLPGGMMIGNTYAATDTARWQGAWHGKFFGNGDAATDLPSAFAGTFGATDAGVRTFAGSFGARQQ